MPNRYIRAAAIESEAVNALSFGAEVFYRRLLNRADDFGRFTANLSLLRASLFPLKMEKVSEKNLAEWLRECADCGLVFTYEVGGKRLLVINKWEQGRAKHSEYPPPPANICEHMQTYVYTRKHKLAYAPDSDSDSDSDTDADTDVGKNEAGSRELKPCAAGAAPTEDEKWLAEVTNDAAYAGIDVTLEHAKAVRWCATNRKKLSRRRFVNWLNRCDRPLDASANGQPSTWQPPAGEF